MLNWQKTKRLEQLEKKNRQASPLKYVVFFLSGSPSINEITQQVAMNLILVIHYIVSAVQNFYQLENTCALYFYFLYLVIFHVNKFEKSKVGHFSCFGWLAVLGLTAL